MEAYPSIRKYCLYQVLASEAYKFNGFERISLFCIWISRKKYEQWPTILLSRLQSMLDCFIKNNCYDIALKINRDIIEKYITVRTDKSLRLNPNAYVNSLILIAQKIEKEKENPFSDASNLLLQNFGYLRVPNIEEDTICLELTQDKVYCLGEQPSSIKCDPRSEINEFNRNLGWYHLLKLMELKSKNEDMFRVIDDLQFADANECFSLYQRITREAFVGECIQLRANVTNFLPVSLALSDIGMIINYKEQGIADPKRKQINLNVESKGAIKVKSMLEKEGNINIKGLEWKLSGLINIRLKFGDFTDRISIDFSKLEIKVSPPTGLLKCKITKKLKNDYYYGELDTISFSLTNIGSEKIKSMCIGTNYPLFFNMEIMENKQELGKGESITISLPFRAAIIGNITLKILVRYLSTKERNLFMSHQIRVLPSIHVTTSLLRNEMSFTEKVLMMRLSIPNDVNCKLCSAQILDKSLSIQYRIPSNDSSIFYFVLKETESFTASKLVLEEGFEEKPHYEELIAREQSSIRSSNHFFAIRWMFGERPLISLFSVSPLEISQKLPIYLKLKHPYKIYHNFDEEPICKVQVEIHVLNIGLKDLNVTLWLPTLNGIMWNSMNPVVFPVLSQQVK